MPNLNGLASIDSDFLEYLMTKVSEFGATSDGGVDRPALTDAHAAARDWFKGELSGRGYAVKVDAIGNLYGQIELAGPDAPLIMLGSHIDSQPLGGRFDGAYGVMCALAAIESYRAQCKAADITPQCNFVVADWMNEEGARFQPSLLGSSVFSNENTLEFALARKDREGRTVAEELVRVGYAGTDTAPEPAAYIEIHVEGGPVLEREGLSVAPQVRHWGALKIKIEVTGHQAHTGPTPMEERKDAVLGAAYVIAEVKRLADAATDTLYTSVARVDVSPNSPNIVPEKAILFCELRSPEQDMLDWSEANLRAALPELMVKAGVVGEIVSIDRRPAGRFDDRLIRLVELAADAHGYKRTQLDTVGGHDAVTINRRIPAIVFVVPSVNGVIHRYDEFTKPEDLANGGDVMTDMVRRIDAAGGDLDKAAAVNT